MSCDPSARRTVPPPAVAALGDVLATDADGDFVRRALDALLRLSTAASAKEPLAGALMRTRLGLDPEADVTPLLSDWKASSRGHGRSASRYRWELSHRVGVELPSYAGAVETWPPWRQGSWSRTRRDPYDVESRYLLPIILSENVELLSELREREGSIGATAAELLDEVEIVVRRDFAHYVQMNEPWEDSFALFCLVRRPRALELLHPIAVAIATSYAAGGVLALEGQHFPFYQRRLVSASAHLALSLFALGTDLELATQLVDFVARERRPNGAWADADQPDDPQATLAAAELLGQVDPTFDPRPTVDFFVSAQGDDGLVRALGPDAPWLTREALMWILRSRSPFAARFRWPHRARAVRDHKTGLPFYSYFVELAAFLAGLPGLARAPVDVAFIDLIGFRAFNNRFGQDAGDAVLALFAAYLDAIPSARAIRDGGDEFLLVGAPTRDPLYGDLDVFRRRWPDVFRERFGDDVPPVTARILVGRTTGVRIRAVRERLGREITSLKGLPEAAEPHGILRESRDPSE